MVYKHDVMWKFQNYVKERSIIFVICTRSNIYIKRNKQHDKYKIYYLSIMFKTKKNTWEIDKKYRKNF